MFSKTSTTFAYTFSMESLKFLNASNTLLKNFSIVGLSSKNSSLISSVTFSAISITVSIVSESLLSESLLSESLLPESTIS